LRGIVLADTGPLYAAQDPDDTHHDRSQRDLRSFQAANLKVVVPYPALLESYSLVMRKLGYIEARTFLVQVVGTGLLENATTEDYQEACGTILSYSDQDISLFDAVIARMSARLERAPVWTYDYHFDAMQANVWR
jgi:predicted nucleic acid-binding protein